MSRLRLFLRLVAVLACGLLIATAGAAHRAPASAETVRAAAFLAVAGDFADLCGSGVSTQHAACDLCCTAASGIAPAPVRAALPELLAVARALPFPAARLVSPARDWSRSVRAPPFARPV